jgi:hypothetical protein
MGCIQEVALETQCHWRGRILDGFACFGDIDIKDRFTGDFLQGRFRAQRCDKPG